MTDYLQKGASVEAEILTAIADALPQDIRDSLPAELKDILLRGSVNKRVPSTMPTYEEAEAVPIATVARNQTGEQISIALLSQTASLLTCTSDCLGTHCKGQLWKCTASSQSPLLLQKSSVEDHTNVSSLPLSTSVCSC